MNIRFYIDPETGIPHIYGHNVNEREVQEILEHPGEDRAGDENARIAIGQTDGGRYLRIVYVSDPEPESVFVITAYELQPRALKAYKKRRRRKHGK